MRSWLRAHRQALALVLRRLGRAPFGSLLTIGVIGIALSMPAGLYVALQNLGAVAGQFKGEPQISLFMAAGATAEDARRIEAALKQDPLVEEFRFIPRDRALQELAQTSGLGDVAAGLERNPLPDAFVVRPATADADQMAKLRDSLQRLPKVDTALLDAAWAKRLNALLELGHRLVLLLAALLGFALLAVTINTIRLQILSHREEIEVSKLIGATDPFVRRPFLYQGTLQGLLGGGAALAVVGLGLHLLSPSVNQLAQLYGGAFQLRPLSLGDSLALLLFAATLGWLGAFLASVRHLRETDPRL
jgi:cell division transport system permease protein